ncbi:ribitol-5-phosphate transferase FKTN-like [Saccoglossus kowalevskii]|uniref:Fukutin-like n=1 Tax=Saccoglossus kowalevskii TaxID=10224 RepID=A0ABM0M0J3_SACKO|nr:PREDICTED: fukutin-like [Saccoglossus kowalevskii]
MVQDTKSELHNAAVSAVVGLIQSWVDPFDQKNDLISTSTTKAVPRHITSDLMKAYEIGEKNYATFRNERLENDPPNPLKLFLEVADSNKIPVFLIDTQILQAISDCQETGQRLEMCSCFYHAENNIITFAVLELDLKYKEAFFDEMRQKGFTSISITGPDSTQSSAVTLHYIFAKSGFVVHLIFFYERIGNFWWHGALTLEDIQAVGMGENAKGVDLSKCVTGQHAQAFDKMDIVSRNVDGVTINVPRFPLVLLNQKQYSNFVGCNYTRVKVFQKKNGADMSKVAINFKIRVRTLLHDTKKVLDGLGIRFWLSAGTLLGWFRECDTMHYSRDVDIEIWAKDYDSRIIQAFQDAGFCLITNNGKPEFGLSLAFKHDVGLKLDVFLDYESNDSTWNMMTYDSKENYQQFKVTLPRFTLCWTEFLEMKLSVPCESELYIVESYGKQWTERVKTWDPFKSPLNVVKVGVWSKADSMKFGRHLWECYYQSLNKLA